MSDWNPVFYANLYALATLRLTFKAASKIKS